MVIPAWPYPIIYWETQCYEVIDVAGGGGGTQPPPGGGGTTPPPPPPPIGSPIVQPTVIIAEVNTVDPQAPVVGVDLTGSNPADPPTSIALEVNGVQVASAIWSGDARYSFDMSPIQYFAEGVTNLRAYSCTVSGVCGYGTATMTRFRPSPVSDSGGFAVMWFEEEVEGPVKHDASYGHDYRQFYLHTTFSCSETGANSTFHVMDGYVTVSHQQAVENPLWTASLATHGTLSNGYYQVMDACASPVSCPTDMCATNCGLINSFGFLPSVDEVITSCVVDGANSAITAGGTLHVSIQ
jgi:hypothetical protein